MISKVLVANRGEIAQRLFRACREMRIPSAAVYSEADKGASWLDLADEAYALPGKSAAESYLNQDAVLDIAQACGAGALHPGYGFLSENAVFAAACGQRGIQFIGPSPRAIRVMGDKAAARELALESGTPVVPGIDGRGLTEAQFGEAAQEIGYPVLIKASAGGGGKGMRVVEHPADLGSALQLARSESLGAFGDDHLLLEKYINPVHHVEVQILGDQHGHLLHLFERECSIQRRHQKIIEESPAPVIAEPQLRQEMTAAAVRLARAAGYTSAGTVEFIVDEEGRFYFLEMNTRLQVEHPITELVTGLDLATWQIRIAAGEALPFAQEEIVQRGHAIECRIYAEDPAQGFLPSTGEILHYEPPGGPGIRVDDGIATGSKVTPYYDPMLAKVIAWGADRTEALAKMRRALRETIVVGVITNIPYLLSILEEPAFAAGRTPTSFLAEELAGWQQPVAIDDEVVLAAAVLESLGKTRQEAVGQKALDGSAAVKPDPWSHVGAWRNVSLSS